MQKKEIIYGLGIAGIGIAALTAYVLRSDHGRLMRIKPKERKVAAACWTPGDQRVYHLNYGLRTLADRNQGMFDQVSRDQAIAIDGWLQVQAEDADQLVLSLNVASYQALGQELADPARHFAYKVAVTFGPDCQMQGLAYDGRMPFKSREIMRSIVTAMRFDRQALQGSDRETSEDDVFGTIAVHYHFEAPIRKLEKVRVKVLQPKTSGDYRQASISFLRSASTFIWGDLARDGFWPRTIEVSESIAIKTPSDPTRLVQEKTLKLEQTHGKPTFAAVAIDPVRRVEKGMGEAFRGRDRSTIYNVNELRRTPAPAGLDDAIQAFITALQNGDDALGKKILGSHLLAHPESLKALGEQLANGDFDSTAAAHIFFLLDRLPLEKAQTVMTDLISNTESDGYLRMQAIIALGDVFEPSAETRQTLIDVAKAGPGERDPQDVMDLGQRLHNTSVLAYGALAANAADVDPEFEAEAKEVFHQLLSDASQPDTVGTILSGIGNFHNPDLYETVETYMDNDHPGIRMSAAQALAKMEQTAAETVLLNRLAQDSHADVREAIAQGLLNRNSLEADHIATVSSIIKQESEAKTRNVLIDVLGRAAQTHPEATQVLVDQARRESDALILQRIGEYVPADQMLSAVKRRGT